MSEESKDPTYWLVIIRGPRIRIPIHVRVIYSVINYLNFSLRFSFSPPSWLEMINHSFQIMNVKDQCPPFNTMGTNKNYLEYDNSHNRTHEEQHTLNFVIFV